MRQSRVVLCDDEIVAHMKASATPNEGAGEVQKRIDAALSERRERQALVQAEYDKGRGSDFGPVDVIAQAKLYPVKEHKGTITAVYKPDGK